MGFFIKTIIGIKQKKFFRENHHQGFGGDYMLTEFYSNSNARVITASE